MGADLRRSSRARLDDARAEAAGAGKRKYERVLGDLRPRDGLQERTHSLFPYLARHGVELAGQSLRDMTSTRMNSDTTW